MLTLQYQLKGIIKMKKEDLYTLVHFLSNKKPICHKADINFLKLVEIANHEFLTSAFFYQLDKNNFLKKNDDEELVLYLNEIFRLNTVRNTQIIEQLKEIILIFDSANIECLLLKGAASLVENDYEHIGIRYLSDIDLMVHPEQIKEAYTLLIKAGYKKVDADFIVHDSYHHLWPIEKKGMPVMLELHRRVMGGDSTIEYIPFSEETSYQSSNPEFLNTWILNPTYKLYHAFLHTELDDNNYNLKYLDLRHLYDFTVLTKKYYDKVDWNKLDKLVKSLNLVNNFQAYLYICKELFNLTTPLTVDNRKVHSNYQKILKSFELRGTIREGLYPLLPNFKRLYSTQRLKEIYSYKQNIFYIYYILKHIIHQLKTYIFCKGCLRKFISKK